jgi:putative sterol carrier protein
MVYSKTKFSLKLFLESLADRVNANKKLIEELHSEGSRRSILLILKDLNDEGTSCGMSIDERGTVWTEEPTSSDANLVVETDYRKFANIFVGKMDADEAFRMGLVDLRGAHMLVDYLLLREFMNRLKDEEKEKAKRI